MDINKAKQLAYAYDRKEHAKQTAHVMVGPVVVVDECCADFNSRVDKAESMPAGGFRGN